MLTSIQRNGRTLTLRSKTSQNIFDVDSLSLLIGPNGSGKTSFLQDTIERFAARPSPSAASEWFAQFNYLTRYDAIPATQWGLIYYNPLPYKPMFKSQSNLIDASRARPKDLFALIEYREILEGFGLEVKLVAKLHTHSHKVWTLLATALVENPKLHSNVSNAVLQAQKYREALRRTSDFDSDQDRFLTIENRYKSALKQLSKDIRERAVKAAKQHPNPHLMNALLAVVSYLVMNKKSSIHEIIGFIEKHLPLGLFNTSALPQSPRQFHESDVILHNTLDLLSAHPFKKMAAHPDTLLYELRTSSDQRTFASKTVQAIFNIDLPGLSSGQRAICDQVVAIYESLDKFKHKDNVLVMIDEGDAFLHLEWQRRYIQQINDFLCRCKQDFNIPNVQVIIASHSPLLASDVPGEFICQLDDAALPDGQKPPSFAAPIATMLNLAFDASTIGEFATRTINQTIANIEEHRLTAKDEYVIAAIDDPIIKRALEEMLIRQERA